MIVHVSSGFIPNIHVDRFVEHITNEVAPRLRTAPAVVSFYLWRRRLVSYEEITTVSIWQSREGLDLFLAGVGDIWDYSTFCAISTEARFYSIAVL